MSKAQPAKVRKLQHENSKLKAEVNKLKNKPANASKSHHYTKNFFRRSGIILLVSLAVALITAGNLLFWFGNTVVKQDRFVAASQPIIKDPVVQDTLALYATNNLFANVDVQKTIEQVLPPRADFLAPQLAKQVKTYTQSTLDKILARPKFQERWNNAMARQHQRLINFAAKSQGKADISLNDIFNQLTARLSDTKLAFLAGKQLPPKVGDITVISAPWLPTFHKVVVNIDTWRTIALVLSIVCVLAAVWLSRSRRRTIYMFSLATASFMMATLLALHIAKSTILNKVDPQYSAGVAHAIKYVFHSLVVQTVTILFLMLFIWLVAWLSGSSHQALAVKKQVNLLFSGKLHESIFANDNKYTLWVQLHKRPLQWGIVALLAIVMLLVRLTLSGLFIYMGLMLVLVLLVEIIGGQTVKSRAR
jgi:hypothetical protein